MTRTLITTLVAAGFIVGIACLLIWAMLRGIDR